MKRSNEPIFWGLFGAGGMVAAIVIPVCILVTGLLIPLGIVTDDSYSYERVLAMAGNLIGAAVLWIIISLPMWHAMHRIYHGLHDLGIHVGLKLKCLCYGIAMIVTIASAVLLLQIVLR
ncbi:fumarate reductase subunit FrdD [Celerinatantimonas sp. YJH-8]|uniref:fumarate reductase subunit FrdD n=1 Tax=Celerinatantimonas sp. YJH-8 TaxID=3228714 RepID=UPI0038CA60C5